MNDEVHSSGIAVTQSRDDVPDRTDAIALWSSLSMSELFDAGGNARYQKIYAVEKELDSLLGLCRI